MNNLKNVGAWALVVIALSGAADAQAQAAKVEPGDFTSCDGYGRPTTSGDGMTEVARSLGIFNFAGDGNTARGLTTSSKGGVEACNDALANTPPNQWMRQVSLMRARAMHHVKAKEYPAALADLDSADALAKQHADVFYNRSLGVGVDLLRAYTLRLSGEAAKAEVTATRAAAQRPYERQMGNLAVLAIGPAGSTAAINDMLKASARFNPLVLDRLYQLALLDGRYEEAVALYPQLVPGRDFVQYNNDDRREQRDRGAAEILWATRGAEYAYALAALGRADAAQTAFAVVQERFAKAVQPPPPLAQGQSSGHRDLVLETNRDITNGARPTLDQFDALLKLRILVLQGHADDAIKAIAAKTPPRSWATAELFDAIATAEPSQAVAAMAGAGAMRKQLRAQAAGPENGLETIWNSLPEAETAKRTPPYRPGDGPLLALNSKAKTDFAAQGEGYRALPGDTAGVTAVRYRGKKGTAAMIGEMALLRAAELAREAGKSGFVIVGRRDTNFTTSQRTNGIVTRTDPDGFETELDVVFVDAGALPAPYAGAPWRVIDAAAAIAALKPLYLGAATAA